MSFFSKDDFYEEEKNKGVELDSIAIEDEEVVCDSISEHAEEIEVTSLLVSILRGILKKDSAYSNDNLIEYISTLTDNDELAKGIVGDVEIILDTLTADNPNSEEIVEDVINGEGEDFEDALDLLKESVNRELSIETLVASYGHFIEETLDSVEVEDTYELDEDVAIDSTAYATMKEAKSGRFDKTKQRVFRSSEHGHKAFRRKTVGKSIRPNQKNEHAEGVLVSDDEKKWVKKSMEFLGYWADGRATDKMKRKMGLRKNKAGDFKKPKKRGSSNSSTKKSNRG